jgi:pantoate--beta-alanine ligase
MLIFKQASDLQHYLRQQRQQQKTIGFVPTMGALHAGHLSLVTQSLAENNVTVCSIFVNPTQFNNPSDFQHYPVTIEKDLELLLTTGCDVLFLPPVAEIYPAGHVQKHYALGTIETILEGAYRPGHFQGVCQVVDRLLELTNPHKLYMGQKDMQQCMVVRRLLEITGRNLELCIGATLREEDGLAMSSRNLRLAPADRQTAVLISQSLQSLKAAVHTRPSEELEQTATRKLEAAGFEVDYIAIRRMADLQPAENGNDQLVVLAAASLNGIRLIDNVPLN